MKLLDYMKTKGVDDAEMAALVGDTTPRAVKKWKYGETTPPLPKLIRIVEVTAGEVTPTDFLSSKHDLVPSNAPRGHLSHSRQGGKRGH